MDQRPRSETLNWVKTSPVPGSPGSPGSPGAGESTVGRESSPSEQMDNMDISSHPDVLFLVV